MNCFYTGENPDSIPVSIVFRTDYEKWKNSQAESLRNWLQTACFKAEPNYPLCIPGTHGNLDSVLVQLPSGKMQSGRLVTVRILYLMAITILQIPQTP